MEKEKEETEKVIKKTTKYFDVYLESNIKMAKAIEQEKI